MEKIKVLTQQEITKQQEKINQKAENLKSKYPELNETQLIFRAIKELREAGELKTMIYK